MIGWGARSARAARASILPSTAALPHPLRRSFNMVSGEALDESLKRLNLSGKVRRRWINVS